MSLKRPSYYVNSALRSTLSLNTRAGIRHWAQVWGLMAMGTQFPVLLIWLQALEVLPALALNSYTVANC